MERQAFDGRAGSGEDCGSITGPPGRKAVRDLILGRSQAVQELYQRIDRLSSCSVNVLIYGDTGTGKELAARAVHYLSSRAGGPFIPVNCSAVPENLFENELFGHVRGAYTDAHVLQTGLVQEAEGGTLFLDEIGAISLYNQAKLLRLLQDREYKRLGDASPHKADVRIVAATNQDLRGLVRAGQFREDLYYRLDVASLRIPPLRERTVDIPILVEHFLRKYSAEYGKSVCQLSSEAMQVLLEYSWPGNIRELENRLQNMIVMASGPVIGVETVNLPAPYAPAPPTRETFSAAKKRTIDSFEKAYLTQVLALCEGNVVQAARTAGKSRTGLWNLIRRHSLSPKDFSALTGQHHHS